MWSGTVEILGMKETWSSTQFVTEAMVSEVQTAVTTSANTTTVAPVSNGTPSSTQAIGEFTSASVAEMFKKLDEVSDTSETQMEVDHLVVKNYNFL